MWTHLKCVMGKFVSVERFNVYPLYCVWKKEISDGITGIFSHSRFIFFSREDHADVDHLWGRNSDKCF